jgi:hypothetical protein
MYFKLVAGKTTKLPAAQTASVVMGDRTALTKLAFTLDGEKLISDKVGRRRRSPTHRSNTQVYPRRQSRHHEV